MRFSALVALGATSLLVSPAQAEVEVRVVGDRVGLRAVSAPVAEILEGLARRTGMKLSYDAAPPRQTLSAAFENRTPAEAVLSVLEGLGLNYAIVMDPSGTRVDQLLILGSAGLTATAASGPGRPLPPTHPQRQAMTPEQEIMAELENEEDAGDPVDAMEEMSQIEAAQEAAEAVPSPAPAPTPSILPPNPEYPASSFSPRLPMPTPAPPSPNPQATPPPRPQ